MPGYGEIRGYIGYLAEVESIHKPSNSVLYKIYRIDCDGRGIPRDGDFQRVRTELPARPGWHDLRTLKQLMSGCCPKQLAAAMFGDPEGAD